jgi:hypothetical protein
MPADPEGLPDKMTTRILLHLTGDHEAALFPPAKRKSQHGSKRCDPNPAYAISLCERPNQPLRTEAVL